MLYGLQTLKHQQAAAIFLFLGQHRAEINKKIWQVGVSKPVDHTIHTVKNMLPPPPLSVGCHRGMFHKQSKHLDKGLDHDQKVCYPIPLSV
jgi:hypothetical protein